MYFPINSEVKEEWNGWSLVMPTVSVGNVGQLAMDIVLNKTDAQHIGYLQDDSLLPVIGNHPLKMSGEKECTLTTSAQVYKDEERKNIYVQIRSPLVRGKRMQFVRRITEWIKACRFGRVLVLTSVHSYERLDSQMTGTQLRWLCSTSMKEAKGNDLLTNMEWMKELEKRPPGEQPNPADDRHPEVFLPGTGFAKELYSECVENQVPIAVFFTFCSEGVNSMDAATLVGATDVLLLHTDWMSFPPSLKVEQPKPATDISLPESWRFMFGNPHEQSIFQ